MESLYLLIPLSVGLVLVILAVLGWAVQRGQFEDLDGEGERILEEPLNHTANHKMPPLDADQARKSVAETESMHRVPLTK